MSIIPNSTCFVAEKLGRNPFLKQMVKELFIIEGQPIEEWLGESREMIDNGLNIIIFPTGRRHFHDECPRLHRGASLIAYTTKKDIAILKMQTSIEFLQIHSPVYEAGSKPVIYDISYIETLNTKELIEKYPDEVTFKTKVTKYLTEKLFNK
jgi:1-acyl-sn-glycerol-3-phosphate acyltransferase